MTTTNEINKAGHILDQPLTPEEKLLKVRDSLLEEIRRLAEDDIESGSRAWKRGVKTARTVSIKRLTWIIEQTY